MLLLRWADSIPLPSNLSGRIATSGLIILVGALLLLGTTGTVSPDSIWAWVPGIFVLLGLWALVSSDFRNLTGPILVIAIAGTYLARNLELIGDDVIGTWWPLFVVLFGVLLLVGGSAGATAATPVLVGTEN